MQMACMTAIRASNRRWTMGLEKGMRKTSIRRWDRTLETRSTLSTTDDDPCSWCKRNYYERNRGESICLAGNHISKTVSHNSEGICSHQTQLATLPIDRGFGYGTSRSILLNLVDWSVDGMMAYCPPAGADPFVLWHSAHSLLHRICDLSTGESQTCFFNN